MDSINTEDIYKEYDNNEKIWPENDRWHLYTRRKIESFIQKHMGIISNCDFIINAGSAGESYGIDDMKTLHIDLISKRIINKPNNLVTNLERIPVDPEIADIVLCVGSVVNYTDLLKTIQEFSRISKKEAYLILEFECSNTLELIFSRDIKANALIKKTYYRGKETRIWYYSKNWVEKILKEYGYKVISNDQWHYLSPLVLKISNKMNFSTYFSKLDSIIKHLPFVNKFYSNYILLARRISS